MDGVKDSRMQTASEAFNRLSAIFGKEQQFNEEFLTQWCYQLSAP